MYKRGFIFTVWRTAAPIVFCQISEKTIYCKGLKPLVAVHLFLAEIVICQLYVNDFFYYFFLACLLFIHLNEKTDERG